MCLPHLEKSTSGHILTLSPPLDLRPKWAGTYLAYTIAKYGMSLMTLGLAEQLADRGIAANSLWPRPPSRRRPSQPARRRRPTASSRTVDIVSDAAQVILTRDEETCTGNFFIDDEVLIQEGITDLDRYRAAPGDGALTPDLFLEA
jgi:citronellol/citronellal dehydrogenase